MQQFTRSASRVHNFRDIGDCITADGRKVKKGMLYRAGVMSGLGEEDRLALRELNITAIFDLRDDAERERKPTDWYIGTGTGYYFREYEQSLAEWSVALRSGQLSAEQSRDIIHEIYESLPFEQLDSYRTLFGLLLEGKVPLLFNCTAGKDRTGLAAALILFALGVDVQRIVEDYSLSNIAIERLIALVSADPANAALAAMPAESYLPIMRAEAGYLDVAFDAIRARHGSIEAYLESALHVGPGERARLQELLLERS